MKTAIPDGISAEAIKANINTSNDLLYKLFGSLGNWRNASMLQRRISDEANKEKMFHEWGRLQRNVVSSWENVKLNHSEEIKRWDAIDKQPTDQ